MKIYTTLSALKAIAILAADNDLRYYLNGVQITANATETQDHHSPPNVSFNIKEKQRQ